MLAREKELMPKGAERLSYIKTDRLRQQNLDIRYASHHSRHRTHGAGLMPVADLTRLGELFRMVPEVVTMEGVGSEVGDKPHRIVVALGYAARCIVKPWSGLKSRQFPWQDALPWAMADRHG